AGPGRIFVERVQAAEAAAGGLELDWPVGGAAFVAAHRANRAVWHVEVQHPGAARIPGARSGAALEPRIPGTGAAHGHLLRDEQHQQVYAALAAVVERGVRRIRLGGEPAAAAKAHGA